MNIAFVSSLGGHSGQIKIIFTPEVIGNNNAILITESSDSLKTQEKYFHSKYRTYFFKKDYLGANPFKHLSTLFKIKRILKDEEIDILITNGAQISLPALIAAKILGIKTLFIETIIRNKTTTWSAKLSYPFSDTFLVQHPNMIKKYGSKVQYVGGIL